MDSTKRFIVERRTRNKAILLVTVLLCTSFYLCSSVQNGILPFGAYLREEFVLRSPKTDSVQYNKSFPESLELSPEELFDNIQAAIQNLPSKYWHKHRKNMKSEKKPCAKYPSIFDIDYNNLYWQTLNTKGGTFHLFSAYHDNRTSLASNPVIRILGVIDRAKDISNTTCQLWFENIEEPIFGSVEYRNIWLESWGKFYTGRYHSHLITCTIPKDYLHRVPVSVSLVEEPCDAAKTNVQVTNNQLTKDEKDTFAVCVKGMDLLNDISVRLIEWLELLFLLGASKVFFYEFTVHPNISKVLKYYEDQGKIEVTKLTLPGNQPNNPHLRHMYLDYSSLDQYKNELITYNDCLYKNMHRYKFISNVDIDEVILPNNATDWYMLLDVLQKKADEESIRNISSFAAVHFYYFNNRNDKHEWFPDIPPYMHMLQHTNRSQKATPSNLNKAFHVPERVLTTHNHYPLSCLGGKCVNYEINEKDAQLMHYRHYCVDIYKAECDQKYKNNIIVDSTIWRYRDPLIAKVTYVLKDLGFL